MQPAELIFGGLLVALLLSLAGYYAWQQVLTLRYVRSTEFPTSEERRYLRNQAWRRLVGCVCLALFAGMLIGQVFLEAPLHRLFDQGTPSDGELSSEQQQFLDFFRLYWIIALLVLLGLLVTAAFDIRAIRRFGIREYRKIQAERRAMIEREIALRRQQRNGQH
jgi:hypothetical protein